MLEIRYNKSQNQIRLKNPQSSAKHTFQYIFYIHNTWKYILNIKA